MNLTQKIIALLLLAVTIVCVAIPPWKANETFMGYYIITDPPQVKTVELPMSKDESKVIDESILEKYRKPKAGSEMTEDETFLADQRRIRNEQFLESERFKRITHYVDGKQFKGDVPNIHVHASRLFTQLLSIMTLGTASFLLFRKKAS
jgi:hypothetical protein